MNTLWMRLSLKARLLGAFTVVALIALPLIGWQTLVTGRLVGEKAIAQMAQRESELTVLLLTESLVLHDYTSVEQILRRQAGIEGVHALRYRYEQVLIEAIAPVRQTLRPDWFADLLALKSPTHAREIKVGGVSYGDIALEMSPNQIEERLWLVLSRIALAVSIGLALLWWLLAALLQVNLKGLAAIREASRRVSQSDFSNTLAGESTITMPEHAPPELRETAMVLSKAREDLSMLVAALKEQKRATDNAALVSETNLAGDITYVNDLFCQVSGYSRDELLGQNHRIVSSGEHSPEFFQQLWAAISSGQVWHGEICNRAKNGQFYWVSTTITPILDESGLPQKYLSIRFDISARKLAQTALAEEKERWRVTLASVGDGVVVTDTEGCVVFMNQVAENLTGWRDNEAHGNKADSLFPLLHEDTRQPVASAISPCSGLEQARAQSTQTVLIRRDGSELAVHDSAAPVRDAQGHLAGCVMVLRDDKDRRAMVRELRWLAFHDPLTGLLNRRAMEGRLERALHQVQSAGRVHTFCYIDLDQFKLVNDTCGHAAGDALLKEIATLMEQGIPQRHTTGVAPDQPTKHLLARLGGDEFGLLLFDTDADTASRIAQGLILAIHGHRFRHGERSFNLGASIGIASLAKIGNVGEALSQADTACYAAKAQGRNRVQIYTPGHAGVRELEAEMHWVGNFESAFAQGRFRLYRQRIVPVQRTETDHDHYEILLRHLRNDGVVEPPSLFLPAAERYGLAPTFDRWVLRTLLAYLVQHPQDKADYSVNLSGSTLSDRDFPAHVQEQIAISGIAPARLTFEITETAVVHDLPAAQHLIEVLSQLGCRFSLDDFGSGLSSFAYLKSLPVHVIKIDGAFVRDLASDPTDYVIVNAIAQIGRDLARETVAEFVENDAILAKLVEIGVDFAQGYGIHMPEPLPSS